jgi:PAS domain S-box-containing protein
MDANHSHLDTDTRRVHLTQISRLLGLVILCLGVSVMLGWIFNIPLLKSIHPTFATMKFNTALLFTLSGLAVYTLPADNRYKKLIPYSIALIAGLTLLQYLFGWNLGIDELFVAETLSPNAAPGRMSVITAIDFMLISVSLISINFRPYLSQICAYMLAIIALLVLAGYLYNVPALYNVFIFSTVALHTAVAFLLLAAALVLANTESYFMRMLVSASAGARLIRQVLPITLILLIITDVLFVLGGRAGFYQHEFIMPLNVVASLVTVIVVISLFANQWHETDLRRIVAEEQLRQSYEQLEQLVQERTRDLVEVNLTLQQSQMRFAGVLDTAHDAIISIDEHEHIIMFNQGAELIFGYSQQEIIGQPLWLLIPERFRTSHNQHIANFAAANSRSRLMAHDRPELTGRHKNGHEFFIEASISRLELDGANIFTVVIRDISQQKAAENELRQYQSAVEASSELIVVVNRDYRYLIANERHLQYNQKQRQDVIGRHVSEIVGQEWFDNLLKPLYDRCFAGESIDFEASPQYPELGTRHLLVNYSPLRDAENQVIAAVVIIRDITERKQAENEMRLYQSAVEASNELITLVGRDYHFLMANDIYLYYHQRKRREIIGRHISEVLGQEVVETIVKPYYERCFAGETCHFENIYKFPSLGERHTWATYSPLYDDTQQVIGVVISIRDITERKQMELALRENEQKLRTLFEVLPVGVSLLNQDRQIVQVNPALESILDISLAGLQAGEYRQRRYIHADGSPMQPEEMPSERAIREQKPIFDVEIGIIKEDNKTVWTSVNAAPLTIDDLSAVIVTQDITHRKSVERALEASMEYLSMLTHALADGILTVDISTRIIQFVNQRFCEIFGYDENELLGQPTRIFYGDDEAHAAFGVKLRQAISTGQLPLITERELRRKNGERFWTSTATSTLTLDGKVTEAISIVRDITERKLAEEQARLLELEQRNVKSLREFITNISHDLKTPITQIITSLYLLKRSLAEDSQQRRITAMENHTNNLRKIIEAMVLMSQLDAKESFEFSPVDGKPLLADLMKFFIPYAEQKQQVFTLQCTVDKMPLQADAEYLQLALRRIIENAIHYTAEGGTIAIRVYQQPAEYIIEIEDTGIGITPEDLPHIFEHFYRGDKARTIGEGHTGMGLAMTYKIIRAHGGQIEVTSQLNEGSTFRVFLPASEN